VRLHFLLVPRVGHYAAFRGHRHHRVGCRRDARIRLLHPRTHVARRPNLHLLGPHGVGQEYSLSAQKIPASNVAASKISVEGKANMYYYDNYNLCKYSIARCVL